MTAASTECTASWHKALGFWQASCEAYPCVSLLSWGSGSLQFLFVLPRPAANARMGWHGLACPGVHCLSDAVWAALQYPRLIAVSGTNYIETLRVQIHANCRIRRIYFSDRLYRCAALHPAAGCLLSCTCLRGL